MQSGLSDTIFQRTNLANPAPPSLLAAAYGASLQLEELSGQANYGMTSAHPPDAAYIIQLRLRECARCDLFVDGRFVQKNQFNRAGILDIYDLTTSPRADLQDPFNLLLFRIPRNAVAECIYDMGGPFDGELRAAPGQSIDDPVARHLFMGIRPAMATPLGRNRLFVEHSFSALLTHISHRYGVPWQPKTQSAPRLSLLQIRRVCEVIDDSLSDDLSLEKLACAVNLSVRQMSRSFESAFNMPPFRFLMQSRIKKAQKLLLIPHLRLIDVAVECGFTTQSHFGRVFKTFSGITPGKWRLENSIRCVEQ